MGRTTQAFGAYAIFFLSGVAGLGYQIVWTRMFAVGLGHETPSTLAVVTAFFGGLALGAWALDGRVSRSKRPGAWYTVLEFIIGGWALASVFVIPVLNDAAAALIGVSPSPLRHWVCAFAIPFVGLLPATIAMGATLPAMDRLVTRLHGGGRRVGGLYAINTAGAMVGIVATTWFVIPSLGYPLTIAILAIVNFACAAGVHFGPAREEQSRSSVETRFVDQPRSTRVLITVFTTGLLGIGFELLCVRVMSQVLACTVYTFAASLTIYLTGTAIGAAVYNRVATKWSFATPLVWLLQAAALACLTMVIILRRLQWTHEFVVDWLGNGAGASMAAEFILASCVFLLPTIVMGALFSHLAQASRGVDGGVGRALALNTLGGALAAPIFSVILIPAIGPQRALIAIAGGYFVLMCGLKLRVSQLVPMAAAALLSFALPTDLIILDAPPGFQVAEYREGVMGSVAVVENGENRLLKVNNRFQMGGTTSAFAERRQAHIPLLLHPGPSRVLFLGVGTGVTAEASLAYDNLKVDAVELVPEVLELTHLFQSDLSDISSENITYHAADARRFVRASSDKWDVIVADLFHPARDGAGSLYTVEHFAAINERLAERGLFCQWLPLHQLDLQTLASILATFQDVFPHTEAYVGHFNVVTPALGLIGRRHAPEHRVNSVTERMQAPDLVAALHEVALDKPLQLFGCRVATHAQLQSLSHGATKNTDSYPVVMFRAPEFDYRGDTSTWDRLMTILEACDSEDVAAINYEAVGFRDKLESYINARNSYLRGSVFQQLGQESDAVNAWLESVQLSSHFRTAHVVSLQAALAQYEANAPESQRILRQLKRLNPGDMTVAHYLRQLFNE